MGLRDILIQNQIITRTVQGDTFILGEEFMTLLQNTMSHNDCIINHIQNYDVKAKKVNIPVISEMDYQIDADGNITNDMDTSVTVTMAIGELKSINLKLCFSNSIFDLQGDALKTFIANELAQAMIGAIHTRLRGDLIAAGCGAVLETYTDTWFKKFARANINNNSVVLMSTDMISMIKGLDIYKEFVVMGVKPIIVEDKNFHGVIVVGKNDIVHVHDGQIEAGVMENVGFVSNLIYFGSKYYDGFVVKNPEHCYCVTWQE